MTKLTRSIKYAIIVNTTTMSKQVQTFKFDPDLIKDLNTEAKDFDTPFNRYVETLLRNHPYRIKRNIAHPERKKK